MPNQPRKSLLPAIILLCVLAAIAVLGVFVYQQSATTTTHVEIPDSPESGIVPADGSPQTQ